MAKTALPPTSKEVNRFLNITNLLIKLLWDMQWLMMLGYRYAEPSYPTVIYAVSAFAKMKHRVLH